MPEYTVHICIHIQEQPLILSHKATRTPILLWLFTLHNHWSNLTLPSLLCRAPWFQTKETLTHSDGCLPSCVQSHAHTHTFHDTLHCKNIRGSLALKPNKTRHPPTTHFSPSHMNINHSLLLLPFMSTCTCTHICTRQRETCSLPGKCCLHILQIRSCTWQRKCSGERQKKEEEEKEIVGVGGFSHRMPWGYPVLSTSSSSFSLLPSLSLSSLAFLLLVSKSVLLRHLTPRSSISLSQMTDTLEGGKMEGGTGGQLLREMTGEQELQLSPPTLCS